MNDEASYSVNNVHNLLYELKWLAEFVYATDQLLF